MKLSDPSQPNFLSTRLSRPKAALLTSLVAGGLVAFSGCRDRSDDLVQTDAQRETTAVAYDTYPTPDRTAETTPEVTFDSYASTPAPSAGTIPSEQQPAGQYDIETQGTVTAETAPAVGEQATDPMDTGSAGFAEADTLRDQDQPADSYAQTETYTQTATEDTYAAADATARQDSHELEQRIRDELREADLVALSEAELNQLEIRVETDNTVVLAGSVADQSLVQEIEDRVSEIEGVASIENQLRAGPTADRVAE